MIAVVDNNVYVSSLLSPHGSPARVLDAWRANAFVLVTSEPLLAEFSKVLSYPRLAPRIAPDARQVIANVAARAIIVTPTRSVAVCRDPDDNAVIEAAIAGGADYIVSGDQDLLDLREFEGIRILTPSEFLANLDPQAPAR